MKTPRIDHLRALSPPCTTCIFSGILGEKNAPTLLTSSLAALRPSYVENARSRWGYATEITMTAHFFSLHHSTIIKS